MNMNIYSKQRTWLKKAISFLVIVLVVGVSQVNFDLVTTAYDVPEGYRLVLAIDTKDPGYKSVTSFAYNLDFEFSTNKQSTLKVPTL